MRYIRVAFNALLLVASIYCFYTHTYVLAVPLLVWFLMQLQRNSLVGVATAVDDAARYDALERNCNVEIKLTFDVGEVLKHPATNRLFERLTADATLPQNTQFSAWVDLLSRNYCAITNSHELIHCVTFNIKNNIVWKNGKVDFCDTIYEEVFIPYCLDDKDDFWSHTRRGLTIRALMVNGIIKLQIGHFSKAHSPEVRGTASQTYRTNETIKSFPLLYYSYRHKIPQKYLNLSAYATDAYYEEKDGADRRRDWRNVVREVNDYKYVCSVADEYLEDHKRWDNITADFDRKRKEWLVREGFKCPNENEDSHFDSFPTHWLIEALSRTLNVSVVNYAYDQEENRARYVCSDFHEERF